MKNKYFQEMRRQGIRYRKRGNLSLMSSRMENKTPFSEGQSFAFRFWAIADRYNSTDIIIDELPSQQEIPVMLETLIRAGLKTFVVLDMDTASRLIPFGCKVIIECKVYRQETKLYNGPIETVKGLRMSF